MASIQLHDVENAPPENDFEEEDCNEYDDYTAEDDDSVYDDEEGSGNDSDGSYSPSGRRAEEITATEIQNAIVSALSKCPNQSCTLHSLTARVFKEVGVLTRGKPREAFKRRTMRCVSNLEKSGRVETYKAKNRRLRLVFQGTT